MGPLAHTRQSPHSQNQGFIYIGLLIGIVVIGIGLSAVSVVWQQTRQREKEQELLFVGDQIRSAITRYYLESPRGRNRFPTQLEDLLDDRRLIDQVRRHLRNAYPDPITGSKTWGEIRLPDGQLVGVYSTSTEAPIKVADFDNKNRLFLDKKMYSEWVFRSPLPAANPIIDLNRGFQNTPGATPGVVRPLPQQQPDPPGFIRPVPRPRPGQP